MLSTVFMFRIKTIISMILVTDSMWIWPTAPDDGAVRLVLDDTVDGRVDGLEGHSRDTEADAGLDLAYSERQPLADAEA
jgi:hypothetical protein